MRLVAFKKRISENPLLVLPYEDAASGLLVDVASNGLLVSKMVRNHF